MKIELYVPTTTPTIKANTKPLMLSPPKRKMVNNTTNVESEVLMVRLNVLLSALFISSSSPFLLPYNPTYSRIRSNTTTVSLIE